MSNPQYCVAIRTLGTAGEKYRQTYQILRLKTDIPEFPISKKSLIEW